MTKAPAPPRPAPMPNEIDRLSGLARGPGMGINTDGLPRHQERVYRAYSAPGADLWGKLFLAVVMVLTGCYLAWSYLP